MAALAGQAQFLITLDQRLKRAVNAANLAIRALRPVDFILGVLPAHRDFEALRERRDEGG